jgi:TRAP-type C4-dicarboxylate transport system permease small subunit
MLTAMMFLTMTDVVLRYIFNRPLAGAFEMAEYMMAVLVSFGIVYCAYAGGHVSVDVVFALLPKRIQRIINIITNVILFALFILIAWQNVLFVKETYRQGLTSAVLYIPAYPFIAIVAVGFMALCLVLFVDLVKALSELRGK